VTSDKTLRGQGGSAHREAQGAVLPFAWAAEFRAPSFAPPAVALPA
jgi:hypothetical protein